MTFQLAASSCTSTQSEISAVTDIEDYVPVVQDAQPVVQKKNGGSRSCCCPHRLSRIPNPPNRYNP